MSKYYFHIISKKTSELNKDLEYLLDDMEKVLKDYLNNEGYTLLEFTQEVLETLSWSYFDYNKVFYTEAGNALIQELKYSGLYKDIIFYLYQRMIDEEYELD